MKIKFDSKYLKICLYVFCTLAALIVFQRLVNSSSDLLGRVSSFFRLLWRILLPFVIGFGMAYLLNPAVNWLEKGPLQGIGRGEKAVRRRRTIGILIIYVVLLSLAGIGVAYIIPRIQENIADLLRKIPGYISEVQEFLKYKLMENAIFDNAQIRQFVENGLAQGTNQLDHSLKLSLSMVVNSLVSIGAGVLKFIIGIIIAFYLLKEKDLLVNSSKRLIKAVFREEKARQVIDFIGEVDDVFVRFIVGKFIDSFIIGILCFIGLAILDIRYNLLISSIVGITNMIPYFGPFIGGLPAVVITLFDSPIKALYVGLFILGLQQFDGWILGPKILGDKLGLSPFWIIFAVIVGGGLFGVLGMFLGVPIIALIRLVLHRYIEGKINPAKSE